MPRFATLLLLTALLAAVAAPRAQDLPVIVGDGAGFAELENPVQPPCPDAGDAGCALNLGNAVYNDPNITDDYYVSSTATGDIVRLYRYLETVAGDKIAIGWTEDGGYGLEFGASPVDGRIVVRVPFEVWNLGPQKHVTDDDVRMIPFLLVDAGGPGGDDTELTTDWFAMDPFVGFADDGSGLPATNAIYLMMPDRENGYDLFEAAAIAAGGAGAAFVDTDATVAPLDPDHLDVGDISPASGNECVHQGGYISWCYRNDQLTGTAAAPNAYGGYFGAGDPDTTIDPNALFVYPIGRVQVVDINGVGAAALPPAGTLNVIYVTDGGEVVANEPAPLPDGAGALLAAPFPNPAAARVTLPYQLAAPAHVRLVVHDVLGREVAVLVDAEQAAGAHTATLEAAGLATGLYAIRLEVDGTLAGQRQVALHR